MCYYPTNLTVDVGTTVTWINSDGSIPHTVTAGWPDSESIGADYPGGKWILIVTLCLVVQHSNILSKYQENMITIANYIHG